MTVTWQEYDSCIDKLTNKITERFDVIFSSLYPVNIDDMIPAIHLSYKLGGVPVAKRPRGKTLHIKICPTTTFLVTSQNIPLVAMYYRPDAIGPTIYAETIDETDLPILMPWQIYER